MALTKISIRLNVKLLQTLNKQVDACFMKRDKFVAHLISTQIADIRTAFIGKRLSNKAYKYISGEIKRSGWRLVNLEIDKDIADRLNAVVKEFNLVRDALLNRMIFFTVAGAAAYTRIGIPSQLENVLNNSDYLLSLPISPLKAYRELMADPLFYVKEAFNMAHSESLYLFDFAELNIRGIQSNCFQCFVDDADVPETPEHDKQKEAALILLSEFFPEEAEVQHAS